MPTTYAHYKFGDDCIRLMPSNLQEICQRFRDEFNFGVHGPDIFFYYNAIKSNEVSRYGTWMHRQSFKEHLKNFKDELKKHDNKDAGLSYILGFLCHFTLDSYAHSYVNIAGEKMGLTHGHIEAQFDRYLLEKDGYNPEKKDLTFSLKPSIKVAQNIAQLYSKWDDETLYKTLNDQVFYLKLLKDSNKVKRFFLGTVMDMVNASYYKSLFIGDKLDEKCKPTNERLRKYYAKALEHFPLLLKALTEYLNEDKMLPVYFDNLFDSREETRANPILDYEEELNHVVDFQK